MTTKDTADAFTALIKTGDFDAVGERFWADDVVSLESGEGPMARVAGKDAVRAKGEWWSANHEVHGFEVEGPFVNGDQFAVVFRMNITPKQTGERVQMDEIATYTVRDGKIVEERFYY